MRNTCCILVAILGITLILSSCGTHDNKTSVSKKPMRILYLTIWADSLNVTFHSVCEEWSNEYGIPVIVEDVPLKDLSSKLATLIEAQSGADVAVFPAHLTILHHNNLADMSSIVYDISEDLGEPYSIAAEMNRVGDKWVGVPLFAWSHIWVYRKDLLDAKGLAIPDTWDQAAIIARSLTDTALKVYGLGIGLGKDDDAAMFFQALLWSFGGKVFDHDGKTILLDSPETRKAVKWLLDLYYAGVIPPGALGWDGASNNKNFLAGQIAITANSPTIYYVAKHDNSTLASHIAHSVYPKGDHGRFSYATGFSLASLQSNTRRAEVNSLIRYIMRRPNYERLIASAEGSVNPLYKGIDAMTLWNNDTILLPAFNSLSIEKPVGWPGPVTPIAAEVFERRILTDMFARIINDKLTIDQAVAEATKRIIEIVQRDNP